MISAKEARDNGPDMQTVCDQVVAELDGKVRALLKAQSPDRKVYTFRAKAFKPAMEMAATVCDKHGFKAVVSDVGSMATDSVMIEITW